MELFTSSFNIYIPYSSSILEHSLGFIILLPFLFIYKSELKKITKKQWGRFSGWLYSEVLWVLLFFTKALFLTGFVDISVVILLHEFQPIFAILLSAIILRERFPAKFYIYAFLALVGGYFVTFKDPSSINFGSATTIMAVFLYWLLSPGAHPLLSENIL